MNTREALTAVAEKCGPRTTLGSALLDVPVEVEHAATQALDAAYGDEHYEGLKGGEAQTACLLAAEFNEG